MPKGVPTFQTVASFGGYQNKRDVTKLPKGVMIKGSKNVLTTDEDSVAHRPGYTVDGSVGTTNAGCVASYDWVNHRAEDRNLRASGTKLEYRYVDSAGAVTYETLMSSLTSVAFNFGEWWWDSEKKDVLLFVNGTNDMYMWTGALTTFASATATTLTKEGANSWANQGFIFTDYSLGDSTSQFDITNPSGSTFRYTYDGTGTDPSITAALMPVGKVTYIAAQNFAAGNNGVFTVTGSGANYFEVTNASGVVESNKTIGTGFIDSTAKQLVIGGTVYSYHAGETSTTLTDVTPDPSSAGHAVASVIHQEVVTTQNTPGADFSNDLLAVLNNNVYVASLSERLVYASKVTDYTDFSYSSPRLPGEGVLVTLDQSVTGFEPLESEMRISAGRNQWYTTKFTLSADLTKQSVQVERLKTNAQSGAFSQAMIASAQNYVTYVSNEPALEFLGRQENLEGPQTRSISDPIKVDFDGYDFTNAHLHYFKNRLYLALPQETKLLIYSFDKGFWEAPWTVPAGRLATIGGELYLHSNQTDATYKLYDGYTDNGQPINAVARFSYLSYGTRYSKKTLTNPSADGYIQNGTVLNNVLYYDFNGFTSKPSKTIDPSATPNILFKNLIDGSLGKVPLGKRGLGTAPSETSVPFFKVQMPTSNKDFYDLAVEFNSDGKDLYWEILSFGGDIIPSTNNNFNISI